MITNYEISDGDIVRYQRQISLEHFGQSGQKKLLQSKVLIIGCGGLGSSVSQYLAGAGIGQLVLADGDTLEISNLHRQLAYREYDLGNHKSVALANQLYELNRNVRVRTVDDRLDGQRLKLEVMMADLIIDCTDNYPARQSINLACYEAGKKLITGAAIGWQGQLISFDFSNKNTPCYRCYCTVEQQTDDQSCQAGAVAGPVVGTVGALQALEGIKMLTQSSGSKTVRLYLFNGLEMTWQQFRLNRDPECPVCTDKAASQISAFITSEPKQTTENYSENMD